MITAERPYIFSSSPIASVPNALDKQIETGQIEPWGDQPYRRHLATGSGARSSGRSRWLSLFSWDETEEQIEVEILCLNHLNDHYQEIDEFEGSLYKRILVPVTIGGRISICNIYSRRLRLIFIVVLKVGCGSWYLLKSSLTNGVFST